MSFPNAFRGVSKLLVAEILNLIATGLIIAAGISGIVGGASAVINTVSQTTEITEETVESSIGSPGVIAAVFMGMGAMILFIIAYIINLVGLAQAGRDENNFRNAFFVSIAVLVISIIASFLSGSNAGDGAAGDIAATARTVCEIFVMVSVVTGIMSLASMLNDSGMQNFGRKLIIIIIVSIGIGAVASFINIFFGANSVVHAVDGIMGLISGIAMLVGYIAYIIYLAKAKKMLREG